MGHTHELHLTANSLATADDALHLCSLAASFIEVGEFDQARESLGPLWNEDTEPQFLSEPVRAEVLLRRGALTGWLGSSNQVPGSQESAKDMLSRSLAIFKGLGYVEKQAEAQIDLSICYWREGAFDEAQIVLEDAERLLKNIDSIQKARIVLQRSMIFILTARPHEALRLLTAAAPLFDASGNHASRGRFHNHLGMALRSLWTSENKEVYLDRAIIEYTASSFHFEQAGSHRLEAAVENNLGFLCIKAGIYMKAHVHLDRARRLFDMLGDRLHVARVDDTLARLHLAEGRFTDALKPAQASVKALEQGDERAVLAESLTTRGVVLARLKRFAEARHSLDMAVMESERAGDMAGAGRACLAMIEEMADVSTLGELITAYRRAHAFLERNYERETLTRLLHCSRTVINSIPFLETTLSTTPDKSLNLEEQVRRFEGLLIKRALDETEGGISHAAKLLGTTHQSLSYKINENHPELLTSRRPPRTRRRSIITKER